MRAGRRVPDPAEIRTDFALTHQHGGVSDSSASDPPDPTPADVSPETPEQDVPSPEVPSPEVSTPADNYQQVDPELRTRFWKVVALLKIAIIVCTIGSLVALFWGDYSLAARLLVPGAAALGYACYRAYRLKTRVDAGEFDHDLDEEGGEPGDDTGAAGTAEATDGERTADDTDAEGEDR